MRKNLEISSQFQAQSKTKPSAIRAYHEVLDLQQLHRKNMTPEISEKCLMALAPFMLSLDKNEDLTSKDKVCIYACYARLLTDMGDLNAALQCTQASIAFDPTDVKTLTQCAQILRQMERYPEAIETLEKARALSPDDKFALTLLAGCYEDTGEFFEAKKCYQEVMARHPHDRKAFLRLREMSNN